MSDAEHYRIGVFGAPNFKDYKDPATSFVHLTTINYESKLSEGSDRLDVILLAGPFRDSPGLYNDLITHPSIGTRPDQIPLECVEGAKLATRSASDEPASWLAWLFPHIDTNPRKTVTNATKGTCCDTDSLRLSAFAYFASARRRRCETNLSAIHRRKTESTDEETAAKSQLQNS